MVKANHSKPLAQTFPNQLASISAVFLFFLPHTQILLVIQNGDLEKTLRNSRSHVYSERQEEPVVRLFSLCVNSKQPSTPCYSPPTLNICTDFFKKYNRSPCAGQEHNTPNQIFLQWNPLNKAISRPYKLGRMNAGGSTLWLVSFR